VPDGPVRARRPGDHRVERPRSSRPEAISLSIDCKNQDEVDYYWGKLTAGGKPSQCGWLEDRYGLSWQVNPAVLGEMLGDPDPKKSKAVMEAMLKMTKIDIATLERAYRGA
jgi:predicted 3-demethylubiquinone-9 3-methyltransferase (glyoxalase superfamily)